MEPIQSNQVDKPRENIGLLSPFGSMFFLGFIAKNSSKLDLPNILSRAILRLRLEWAGV
jgi:hypothetical protein